MYVTPNRNYLKKQISFGPSDILLYTSSQKIISILTHNITRVLRIGGVPEWLSRGLEAAEVDVVHERFVVEDALLGVVYRNLTINVSIRVHLTPPLQFLTKENIFTLKCIV